MVLDLCRYTHLLHPISVLLPVQRRGFRGTVIVPSMCALITGTPTTPWRDRHARSELQRRKIQREALSALARRTTPIPSIT